MPTETAEFCQCGHRQAEHFNSAECVRAPICPCTHFTPPDEPIGMIDGEPLRIGPEKDSSITTVTPPVDEREKATEDHYQGSRTSTWPRTQTEKEKACTKAVETACKGFGSSAGGYPFMFDAGWNARDAEIQEDPLFAALDDAVTDYKARLLAKLDELYKASEPFAYNYQAAVLDVKKIVNEL